MSFTNRGSDRVIGVSLGTGFGAPGDAKFAGPSDFDTLKTLLIQKYGNPATQESTHEDDRRIKNATWTFPSTSIDLLLMWLDTSPGIQNIWDDILEIPATDKKALDKYSKDSGRCARRADIGPDARCIRILATATWRRRKPVSHSELKFRFTRL